MTSSYDRIAQNYIQHERFLKLVRHVNQSINDVKDFSFKPSWNDSIRVEVRFTYVKTDGTQSTCVSPVPENFSGMNRFMNYWDITDSGDFDQISYDLFFKEKLPNFNCKWEAKSKRVRGSLSEQPSIRKRFEDLATMEIRTRTQFACERLRLRLWEAAEEYRTSDRFKEESDIFLRKEIKAQFKRVVKPFGKVSDELLSEAFREFIVESVLES